MSATVHLPADRDKDAWQLAVWNADEAVLSRAQKLEIMGMIESAFNAFDPFVVVRDLLGHRDRWVGAVMSRGFPFKLPGSPFGWFLHSNLIDLRDIDRHRNLDTVYIFHELRHADALKALAGGWRADEIGPVADDAVGPLLGLGGLDTHGILRVWWD